MSLVPKVLELLERCILRRVWEVCIHVIHCVGEVCIWQRLAALCVKLQQEFWALMVAVQIAIIWGGGGGADCLYWGWRGTRIHGEEHGEFLKVL